MSPRRGCLVTASDPRVAAPAADVALSCARNCHNLEHLCGLARTDRLLSGYPVSASTAIRRSDTIACVAIVILTLPHGRVRELLGGWALLLFNAIYCAFSRETHNGWRSDDPRPPLRVGDASSSRICGFRGEYVGGDCSVLRCVARGLAPRERGLRRHGPGSSARGMAGTASLAVPSRDMDRSGSNSNSRIRAVGAGPWPVVVRTRDAAHRRHRASSLVAVAHRASAHAHDRPLCGGDAKTAWLRGTSAAMTIVR